MSEENMPPGQVRKAVEIYMALAYPAAAPASVRTRVEALRGLADDAFYAHAMFERDKETPPSRYALRLGNQFYPHMKLMLERSPDGRKFLLRADTHDRHVCPPPASKEYAAFYQLMERNQKLAQSVEAAWAAADLPTFKTYLRDDLARRQAAK